MVDAASGTARELKLLLLLDKKPGHFHQTEGVALALGRLAKIEPTRLEVRQRPFILVGLLRLAMKLPLSPRFGLWLLYGIRLDAITRPDGIIASGRATAAAAILLARHFKVPVVFSGLLEGYDPRDITLQLVGRQSFAGQPGYAVVSVPNVVAHVPLPPAKPLRQAADLRGARLALLVGGDSGDLHFTDGDWTALLDLVGKSKAELGVEWHVSTSRRTPPEVADAFAELAVARTIAQFVDYRHAGPGSATALYALDAIIVTQDSKSMTAEALSSGRPVMVLQPDQFIGQPVHELLAAKIRSGQLKLAPIANIDPRGFGEALLAYDLPPQADPVAPLLDAVAPIFKLSSKG